MQLTNDLVRDVLITLEQKLESYTDEDNKAFYDEFIHWKYIYEDEYLSSKYIEDDIKYCIETIWRHGLINAAPREIWGGIDTLIIRHMTWEGHELLNSIRDDKLWEDIKKKIGGIAKTSISVISKVACEYGIEYIKSKL